MLHDDANLVEKTNAEFAKVAQSSSKVGDLVALVTGKREQELSNIVQDCIRSLY